MITKSNRTMRKRLFSRAAGTLALTARRVTAMPALTVRRAATVLLMMVLMTATAWAGDAVSYIGMDGNTQPVHPTDEVNVAKKYQLIALE